jgi:mono/diheme cytochrome c family protein
VAAPVTYALEGRQYVAVMAGWGGGFTMLGGDAAAAAGVTDNPGRLLVFELGGTARLPIHRQQERELAALPGQLDPELVKRGNPIYHRWCMPCHGFGVASSGVTPDLRRSDPAVYPVMEDIVLRGARLPAGMPRFDEWLTPEDVQAIRAYVLSRRAALAEEQAKRAPR